MEAADAFVASFRKNVKIDWALAEEGFEAAVEGSSLSDAEIGKLAKEAKDLWDQCKGADNRLGLSEFETCVMP